MAMSKNTDKSLDKGERLPIAKIPEVQEYMDIKQELDALRADHPEVFIVYNDLIDRHNTALEKAESVVRSRGVTCGPFENFSVSHTINPDKMFDELGEKNFLACGGKVSTRAFYSVDSAVVEANIASGKIPAGAVPNFRTKALKYHAPKKITG